MMAIRDLPIRRKITWAMMAVSLTALLLACVALLAYDLVTYRDATVRNLSTLAQILGFNSAAALLFNDPASATTTLAALKAQPHVISAGIYTRDGQQFATYLRATSSSAAPPPRLLPDQAEAHVFEARQLVLYRRIVFEGEPVGVVYIRSDLEEIRERTQRYIGIAAIVLFASLLVALLISFRIQRVISDPILHLAATAETISARKDYSVRAVSSSRDEIGLLIRTFNEMLAQIEQSNQALQQAHDHLEQRVKSRTAELQAINTELEAFTYSVSHDLRAPLRHIDGFSQILVQQYGPQLDPQAQHYLQRVHEGAQHMGRLVDDLLNLSHVGRRELKPQLAGLNSVVNEVLRDLPPETNERKVEWQIGPLPFVECDAALIKQVFANLLSNAVKYTRPRERAVIEVGQKSENGKTAIYVRDNGVGFSMKYADKLFGIFQRLHRVEDFEGTGVGLATVQRIIARHGGRVWADAELDKGATFYFTLGEIHEGGYQVVPAGRTSGGTP